MCQYVCVAELKFILSPGAQCGGRAGGVCVLVCVCVCAQGTPPRQGSCPVARGRGGGAACVWGSGGAGVSECE